MMSVLSAPVASASREDESLTFCSGAFVSVSNVLGSHYVSIAITRTTAVVNTVYVAGVRRAENGNQCHAASPTRSVLHNLHRRTSPSCTTKQAVLLRPLLLWG